MAGVLAFAEQRGGSLKKVAFEILSEGKRIADQLGVDMNAVVIGAGVEGLAEEIGKYGAKKVYVVDNGALEKYNSDSYALALAEVIKQDDSDVVLGGASAMGLDVFPMVAAKLDTGLINDCIGFKVEGGKVIAHRPIYAAKAYIDAEVTSKPQMLTARPNSCTADEPGSSAAEVVKVDAAVDSKVNVLEVTQVTGGRPLLTEADIIVSGGRGMKGPENFKLIEDLADVLGAAVGASRAAVDAGWREHPDQVGQTGKAVSPNLYIACGISGAIQHLAGMGTSKVIVAINKDPEAPIFTKADYGIVDDLFKVVPVLTEEFKKALAD